MTTWYTTRVNGAVVMSTTDYTESLVARAAIINTMKELNIWYTRTSDIRTTNAGKHWTHDFNTE